MAQRKSTPLSPKEREVVAKKAANHKRLRELAEEASRNLKPTDRWRKVTEEHKEMVLYRLYGGETLRAACMQMGIDVACVNMALYNDEEFAKRAAIARAHGQATRVERLDEIPFDTSLSDARAKLLSDNIKWIAARADRYTWGDKLDISSTVESTMQMPDWMFGQVIDATALPPTEPDEEQPE